MLQVHKQLGSANGKLCSLNDPGAQTVGDFVVLCYAILNKRTPWLPKQFMLIDNWCDWKQKIPNGKRPINFLTSLPSAENAMSCGRLENSPKMLSKVPGINAIILDINRGCEEITILDSDVTQHLYCFAKAAINSLYLKGIPTTDRDFVMNIIVEVIHSARVWSDGELGLLSKNLMETGELPPQGIFPTLVLSGKGSLSDFYVSWRTGGWFDIVGVNDLTLEETRKMQDFTVSKGDALMQLEKRQHGFIGKPGLPKQKPLLLNKEAPALTFRPQECPEQPEVSTPIVTASFLTVPSGQLPPVGT
ncbi:hypothetical protein MJG53_015982 [Ovis ammon polii x Ovis aries]|uniref:Uncharacterized protein n=1 Tax=Ovis ammon polii x Ovis aries TaxID=2918886 RepID=A0ACB9UCY8_9CETA|nr:hypothetical protein MJG53_015982 [Ovis ammon polii x Ovis aries]